MKILKEIALQHNDKLTFKLRKFLIYKLFFASLVKKGNNSKAKLKMSKIAYYLKKSNKKQSPQHLIFLAVNALRPAL
jgi:hypothetical protein